MKLQVVHRHDENACGKSAVNWSTANSRIKEIKDFLLNAPQQVDPFRLHVIDEVYEKYRGEPTLIIRARVLEKLFSEKNIFLDDNPIVGTLTGVRAGVYTYPEWNVTWIKDEMDLAKMSSLGEVSMSDETSTLMKAVYNKWKGKTLNDRWQSRCKEIYGINFKPLFKYGLAYNSAKDANGHGATNYSLILNKGVSGLIAEIDEKLQNMPFKIQNTEKIEFYRACKIALKSLVVYANRYVDLAESAATEEHDPKIKAELKEIATVCRRVPEYPPQSFREAIQAFWFTHLAIAIEQMGCGISVGRYGQYMCPFFQKDMENGSITREEAMSLIKFQFLKHLELGVYQGRQNAMVLSGHTGQTISLGGVTADGQDASTDLDELLIDVQIEMQNIQPTLSIFYHPKIRNSLLQKAVQLVRCGGGQPQFIDNNATIQRHLQRFSEIGITLEEARNCTQFGCVSTGVTGGSYSLIEHYPNLPKFIEMALYDGKDAVTGKKLSVSTGDINDIQSFEEFYEIYMKHLDHFMSINRIASDVANSQRATVVPSLLLSTLSTGCLDAGVPMEAGGGRFVQSVFTLTGGIDAVNCLLAIKNLIFDRRKLTFEQLLEALRANFEGFEDIHKMCMDAPKYGNDNPEIDTFTRKFYNDVDELHNKYGPDCIGRKTMAEAYSLTYNNYFGSMMEALPNGRKRGFALTDGSVSAMPGTDNEGSTALIKSAANAIDTVRFGSNHLNMKFLPSALESSNGSRMLLSLIKTYFDLGGYHIQFNCVSADTLKNAQDKPDDYKNLMVRVAGFSAYYTRLDKGVQNEIIKRTEYTE